MTSLAKRVALSKELLEDLPEKQCSSVDLPGTGHIGHVVYGVPKRGLGVMPKYWCPGVPSQNRKVSS